MRTQIRAHFDGRVIVPDEPLNLPVNEPLSVEVSYTGSNSTPIPDEPTRTAALTRLFSRPVSGVDIPPDALRRESMYGDD
jgi:hypothetical protein